jgi:hypothetical protein
VTEALNDPDIRNLIAKLQVRETIEDYLNYLDDKNWDGIARCFTDDSESLYNHEPRVIKGGKGVVEFLHRIASYRGTNHSLGNLHIEITGQQTATCDSRVIASVQSGEAQTGRVSMRAIRYQDELVKIAGKWRIKKRLHAPYFQCDVPSQPLFLL